MLASELNTEPRYIIEEKLKKFQKILKNVSNYLQF